MDFELTEDQDVIRKAVAELVRAFDDRYWMERDQAHEFPTEFYNAIASGGWLGITVPEQYGGHGLGFPEASLLLEEVARSGGRRSVSPAVRRLRLRARVPDSAALCRCPRCPYLCWYK